MNERYADEKAQHALNCDRLDRLDPKYGQPLDAAMGALSALHDAVVLGYADGGITFERDSDLTTLVVDALLPMVFGVLAHTLTGSGHALAPAAYRENLPNLVVPEAVNPCNERIGELVSTNFGLPAGPEREAWFNGLSPEDRALLVGGGL